MRYDLAVRESQDPADGEAATKFQAEQTVPRLQNRIHREVCPATPPLTWNLTKSIMSLSAMPG
jgi:hypothetical protein